MSFKTGKRERIQQRAWHGLNLQGACGYQLNFIYDFSVSYHVEFNMPAVILDTLKTAQPEKKSTTLSGYDIFTRNLTLFVSAKYV